MTRYGEGVTSWKGDKAGYKAQHKWINERYGRANTCINPDCLKESNIFEWANISGRYVRSIADYMMLCRSCHHIYDNRKKVQCKKGHDFSIENSGFRKGRGKVKYRYCKECKNSARRKK